MYKTLGTSYKRKRTNTNNIQLLFNLKEKESNNNKTENLEIMFSGKGMYHCRRISLKPIILFPLYFKAVVFRALCWNVDIKLVKVSGNYIE